jgi:hypothetical protein
MIGSRLMEGEAEVADFASREPGVRFYGFVQINMPYPFADRITDEQWNSKSPTPPTIAEEPKTERAGAGQPATRPEPDSEGSNKPQPESEGRSR